jgi:hypothetical protein
MARALGQPTIIALLASGLFTASYLIPFLNIPALIAFVPLARLFPSLGVTGPAVELFVPG